MTKYLILFGSNTLLFCLLNFLLPAEIKIDIRFALFSHFVRSNDLFRLPLNSGSYSDLKFRAYKQQYLQDVLEKNEISRFCFHDSVNMEKRVQKITLTYSKNGGEGCGDLSDDLIESIKWLHSDKGHGCCSDHSQAFIAMCLVNQIFAREVHHASHTFNEYFDPKTGKWVWVDSQFCLMAKNEQGELMGIAEIYELFQKGQIPDWYFYGTSNHFLYHKVDIEKATKYFNKSEFGLIAMTLGNNVFENDHFNKKYSKLPREVRQGLLLLTGVQPSYLIFDPFNQKKSYFTHLRTVTSLLMGLLLIVNLMILFKKPSSLKLKNQPDLLVKPESIAA